MVWLHHLFDASGFPTIATYGKSWDASLVTLFIFGKALGAAAYFIFVGVFIEFCKLWRRGCIDRKAAEVHLPRVVLFYLAASFADCALQMMTIVAFWHPFYRLLGMLALVSTALTFAAALKSFWALMLCVTRKG